MSQDITVNPFLQSFWGVNQLYTTGGSRDMENQAILSLRGPKKQKIVFSLKKSMEAHFNRSKIFLLHFYDACDVNLWKKKFGRSTAYSWRTNDSIKFHHLMKKKKKRQLKQNIWVFGLSGPYSIFSQLNLLLFKVHSLWSCVHYFQWFTGYLSHVDLPMSQVAKCFKETALLFNVYLSCFVGFILWPNDKYMFKVTNKKID